jgi:hypothetical protein
MYEDDPEQLSQVVQSPHGGNPVWIGSEPIKEVFDGKTVWEGIVHIFDLDRYPRATGAYASSSPLEGSAKRRFFAVLHLGGSRSPLDAVRAAIVAERRAHN